MIISVILETFCRFHAYVMRQYYEKLSFAILRVKFVTSPVVKQVPGVGLRHGAVLPARKHVKSQGNYSYFEKGCRKKCARANPER